MKIQDIKLGATIRMVNERGETMAEGVYVRHNLPLDEHDYGTVVCVPAEAVVVPADGVKKSGSTWTEECWDGHDAEIVAEPAPGSHLVLVNGSAAAVIRITADEVAARAEVADLIPSWQAAAEIRAY